MPVKEIYKPARTFCLHAHINMSMPTTHTRRVIWYNHGIESVRTASEYDNDKLGSRSGKKKEIKFEHPPHSEMTMN